MKLYIVTIVLDGQPFISHHIDEIRKCSQDWEWHIVEGAASNNADTSWCAKQDHRLSRDGTTEYIDKLSKSDPRVKVYRNKRWNSKTSMVNAAVTNFREPGILLQMDVDEFWTGRQLDILVGMFKENPSYSVAQFYCRYYIGPDITTTGNFNYGNKASEWVRAWRFKRGMIFNSHEPPVLSGNRGQWAGRDYTRSIGLVFDHYAWLLRKQVAYKETFYKYPNAVAKWELMQKVDNLEFKLKEYLPWVYDEATAKRTDEPKTPTLCAILQQGQ